MKRDAAECVELAQDTAKLGALVNVVMNFRLQHNAGNR
jgi:hypothetical protein